MKMKIALISFGVVLLGAAGFGVKTYSDAGEFKSIREVVPGTVRQITGVLSSEDITIDRATGMAYVSSDDRRTWLARRPAARGAIMAFSMHTPDAPPRNLTPSVPEDFHPHGISLYHDAGGKAFLFVVNHPAAGDAVEIFEVGPDSLRHLETISDERVYAANDLLAVGRRRFYVTNDHGSTTAVGKKIEEYLQLPRSSVLYFDGEAFRRVAGGLKYANGINMSLDERFVYVAATVSGKVHIFARDPRSGDLTPSAEIDTGTGIDNIEVAPDGTLWLGAHPKLLTFVAYANDPKKLSPSQVLAIAIAADGSAAVREVFMDSGALISGSSVAAPFKNAFLVGSVFDPGFLLCEMGSAQNQK